MIQAISFLDYQLKLERLWRKLIGSQERLTKLFAKVEVVMPPLMILWVK